MSEGERGAEGRIGERGDQGQTGVTGERGPKGDHGQHGETGARGERGAANRLAMIGYVLLSLGIIGALWLSNHNSNEIEKTVEDACRGSQENRDVLRELITAGDPTKLTKGQPGYDYYLSHPRERRAGHRKTVRILRDTVPPIECP